MDNSGIGDLLEIKTFENYETTEVHQRAMKRAAINYTKDLPNSFPNVLIRLKNFKKQ